MLAAFLPIVETTSILPHQGDTHRISRHAMSLFNCEGFEDYRFSLSKSDTERALTNERKRTVFRTNPPSYPAPCRKRAALRKLDHRRIKPAWIQAQSWHALPDSSCAGT